MEVYGSCLPTLFSQVNSVIENNGQKEGWIWGQKVSNHTCICRRTKSEITHYIIFFKNELTSIQEIVTYCLEHFRFPY